MPFTNAPGANAVIGSLDPAANGIANVDLISFDTIGIKKDLAIGATNYNFSNLVFSNVQTNYLIKIDNIKYWLPYSNTQYPNYREDYKTSEATAERDVPEMKDDSKQQNYAESKNSRLRIVNDKGIKVLQKDIAYI